MPELGSRGVRKQKGAECFNVVKSELYKALPNRFPGFGRSRAFIDVGERTGEEGAITPHRERQL